MRECFALFRRHVPREAGGHAGAVPRRPGTTRPLFAEHPDSAHETHGRGRWPCWKPGGSRRRRSGRMRVVRAEQGGGLLRRAARARSGRQAASVERGRLRLHASGRSSTIPRWCPNLRRAGQALWTASASLRGGPAPWSSAATGSPLPRAVRVEAARASPSSTPPARMCRAPRTAAADLASPWLPRGRGGGGGPSRGGGPGGLRPGSRRATWTWWPTPRASRSDVADPVGIVVQTTQIEGKRSPPWSRRSKRRAASSPRSRTLSAPLPVQRQDYGRRP